MRLVPLLGFLSCAAMCLAADRPGDRVAEIARRHLDALGGKERVTALSALRATGQVTANGKQVRFTLTAARPNRVRLETESGPRTLVQGSDGVEPPWEFDTGTWPPKYRAMPDASVKTFVADSEFDDPLVAGAARGYTLEYSGEIEVEERKLLRILATRKSMPPVSLLIDPETYLIVMRVEQRPSVGGRNVQVGTNYEDYRAVQGVKLPYLVTVMVDGRVSQQTKIAKIEPNPPLTAETFTRPKAK